MSILAIASTHLKSWIRSREAFFFSLIFPLIFLVIFSSIFTGSSVQTITLYVQNQDIIDGNPSEFSKIYINILNSTKLFNIKTLPSDVDAVNYLKEENKGNLAFKLRLLIIPKGFNENITNIIIKNRIKIEIENIKFLLNSSFINETLKNYLKDALLYLNQTYYSIPKSDLQIKIVTDNTNDQDYIILSNIIKEINNVFLNNLLGISSEFNINTINLSEQRLKPIDYYLTGILTAFVMTNSLFGLAPSIAYLRERGILKRLISTPLKKSEFFIGLILSVITMNFILLTILALTAVLIYGATFNFNLFWVVIFITGIIFFSGLGIFIGTLSKKPETASVLVNVIGFPMMFLSGAFWPIEIMPEFLQYVAKLLPLYYYSISFRYAIILNDINLALTPFLIVFTLSIIFIIFAIKTLVWEEK